MTEGRRQEALGRKQHFDATLNRQETNERDSKVT